MAAKNSVLRALIATLAIFTLLAIWGWAGGSGGQTAAGLPLFAIAVIVVVVIQLVGFAISVALRSERLFDLTGALTYLSVTICLVLAAPKSPVTIAFGVAVSLWALRLGVYLSWRAYRYGDARLDQIITNPARFLVVWLLQALWVSITAGPAWAAITSGAATQMHLLTWVGLGLWAFGLIFETVADWQKTRFKLNPANRGEFISSGLWKLSQHPNYFGEIIAWLGIYIAATPFLTGPAWAMTLSPVFVYLLLTRVSGIPTLDKTAVKKWGDRADWRHYRKVTPVLFPDPRLVSK